MVEGVCQGFRVGVASGAGIVVDLFYPLEDGSGWQEVQSCFYNKSLVLERYTCTCSGEDVLATSWIHGY